ncbi:Tetratricopeptide repeat protein 4 [Galdieria sulphuraria]|nr:Tetratricopeptide repeat protein 4 [Galdieria sulphuraria]
MHGVVLDAPLSRRSGTDLVLQVLGCHFPSLFDDDEEEEEKVVGILKPHIISMGNVVDIYEGSQPDGLSFCTATSVSDSSLHHSIWKSFRVISSRVESILFSISFQHVEGMYQSFSKMDNERSFPSYLFCQYLFPGRQLDLCHWIVTGLVLKSLKQHFRRGPPGQGFIVESRASRRSKSLFAWKLLWDSVWKDKEEWYSKSAYERGRLISMSPLLFVDAVQWIGHLEQCLYEGHLDKEAQVVLKSLNVTPSLQSLCCLLEECGSMIPSSTELQLLPSFEEEWMHPIIRQREKRMESSCSHKLNHHHSLHSYCFDTQDSIALDDAISVERVNDHYVIVSVHIIDVASYIPTGCPLDEEARRREETLYMKNKTFHMLPPKWLRLLSFSTEWNNDTLAARFHIDISHTCKVIKEELVPMQIPPIHRCYRFSPTGLTIVDKEEETMMMENDWNILWTFICFDQQQPQSIPRPISKMNIEYLLDYYLTRASALIRKHVLSSSMMICSFQQDKEVNKFQRMIRKNKKRLGTRPLRKYEDLMIQRLCIGKETTWKDVLQYYENKKDRMKHIRLVKIYNRFFQQWVFQRGCRMNEKPFYVMSDIWEYHPIIKRKDNLERRKKYPMVTLRIYLWDWNDIPLFCPSNYSLPKPQELDEETEKTCLGALSHLAFDEPSTTEKIQDWQEKGKAFYIKKKYKQAIDCYTKALHEWQKETGLDPWTGCVLYSNRAAAQLALKNYGKALEDCQQSLALGTFEKSYYRGCIAALAIQKWKQAQVLLQQAKENNALEYKRIVELEEKIATQSRQQEEEKRREVQLQLEKKTNLQSLINALKDRNIRLGLPLFVTQKWSSYFQPQILSNDELSWPVLFVYPVYEGQSDLLENCVENVKLCELLALLFSKRAPWDYRGLYHQEHLKVFYYTNWTPCLEEMNSAVEYLYSNKNGNIEASPIAENEMGSKIVVSQQLSLSQIISRKDYVVPLYPVFFVMPS